MRAFLATSRPRFWLYLLGPFLVGTAAALTYIPAHTPLLFALFIVLFLYFTFPANLFLYGVNDIFDYETDVQNAKKQGYETLVPPDRRRALFFSLLAVNIPFLVTIVALIFLTQFQPLFSLLALVGFLFFSLFYSAPPIRAKTIPFLDAGFNVLYVFPALLGWTIFAPDLVSFSWIAFLGGALWCVAMHAYSAVPDITADSRAGFSTIATTLGLRGTLFLCGVLFGISSMIAHTFFPFFGLLFGIPYLLLILLSLRAGTESGVRDVYRSFPLINTVLGALLFFFTLLT